MRKRKYIVTFGRYQATGRMFSTSPKFTTKRKARAYVKRVKHMIANPRIKKVV